MNWMKVGCWKWRLTDARGKCLAMVEGLTDPLYRVWLTHTLPYRWVGDYCGFEEAKAAAEEAVERSRPPSHTAVVDDDNPRGLS